MVVSRRSLLIGGGAGLATLGAGGWLIPRAQAAEQATINVGQSNILYKVGPRQFGEDLQRVARRSDLFGLNEVGDRRDALLKWGARNGWHVWAPAGQKRGRPGANAMLARKNVFQVVERGAEFICDSGDPGVGGENNPPPRWLNWVRYLHVPSGMRLCHLHTHLNSHIDNGGRPYQLPRTQDAERHLRILARRARAFAKVGQVVVTGDFNVDYADDSRVKYRNFPFAVLEGGDKRVRGGLRSNWSRFGAKGKGTIGNSHFDYIYLWERPGEQRLNWVSNTMLAKGHSDHRAVVAKLAVRAGRGDGDDSPFVPYRPGHHPNP